jgi:HMG box factor
MDIHFLGKIATLRQVAHPIKGERGRHRGCIIAVEGDRETPISAVVGSLVEMLRKTGEFDVKVMEGPRHPGGKVTFENYIEEVRQWHSKAPGLCRLLDWNKETGAQMQSISEDTSQMDVDSAPPADQNRRNEAPSSTTARIPPLTDTDIKKIPLLVIPNYLVGASNTWAAALPVVDDYSVFNHWQWVATLWRGIPGPDFTLYIAGGSRTRTSSSSSDAAEPPPQGQGQPQQRFGPPRTAVEFKEEHGTIIIHKEKGSLDPSAIRRAAFEIGEWARVAAGHGK